MFSSMLRSLRAPAAAIATGVAIIPNQHTKCESKWSVFPKPTTSPNHVNYLFYNKSMEDLAKKVQALHPETVKLVPIKWSRFPDGFPDIKIDPQGLEEAKHGRSVTFLSDLSKKSAMFEQLCLIYALPKHHLPNIRVIVPWFSTGTMERVESYGQVASAKSLARMLSNTPMGRGGPVTYNIYDIHALQEQFYFDDNVIVQLETAVFLLRQRLGQLPDKSKVTICFPDDGSHKRFKKYFPDYPVIVCGKERDLNDPDKRVVKVKEGDATGRHCVIIDDLVQSGGTLIECAKGLKAGGADKMSCFVTHAIFPKESWAKFTEGPGKDYIHKFWVTDSVPHTAKAIDGKGPFEVLSLASAIGHLITGE
eukprot:TRINITY_DN84191_c0_g1_i1.p1 TRINITY_DN84191_c0_g1~~TRINITY_DN84191_c0_g1_i1.p1  ORF type:complete len:364 (+),score=46.59 TRINITY_DN84191_c0_g1_i1:92-1183(+)